MILKRIFDILISSIGLILCAPFFLLIALLIKIDSAGPVFFRQERIGRHGIAFNIHKFRTMANGAENQGSLLTIGDDKRITRVGLYLRKYKIDEFAQLIDVFIGNMSMVGPRPEVPSYVAHYPTDIRRVVLSVRPGITDYASIKFKSESEILGKSSDPYFTYVTEILPVKLQYHVKYVAERNLLGDIRILIRTILAICS